MSQYAQRLYEQRYGTERSAEDRVYERGCYAEGARFVDLCMRVSDKGCAGGPDGFGEWGPSHCDEGAACSRHSNIPGIVRRWIRRYSLDDLTKRG